MLSFFIFAIICCNYYTSLHFTYSIPFFSFFFFSFIIIIICYYFGCINSLPPLRILLWMGARQRNLEAQKHFSSKPHFCRGDQRSNVYLYHFMSETLARFGIACSGLRCLLLRASADVREDQPSNLTRRGHACTKDLHCFLIFIATSLQGLYAGLSAGMLRQVTYGMPRMAFVLYYEKVRCRTKSIYHFTRSFLWGLAGGTASIIGVPSEVSLVRMSGDRKLSPTDPNRRNYTSAFNAAVESPLRKESPVYGKVQPQLLPCNIVEHGPNACCITSKEVYLKRLGCLGFH